jgi:hypothetical protein
MAPVCLQTAYLRKDTVCWEKMEVARSVLEALKKLILKLKA